MRRGFENGDGLFWEIQLQSLTGSPLSLLTLSSPPDSSASFTTFNEVSLMDDTNGEDLLNNPLSLTAHPFKHK